MAGHKYIRHKPCPACAGSGKQTHWVDVHQLAMLLNAIAAEKDAE